jgi:hypothetical protein
MRTCIARHVLGTDRHLLQGESGQFSWVSHLPDDAWGYGFSQVCLRLDELAHAMGTQLNWQIPEEHQQAMRECLGPDASLVGIRWDQVLPKALFKKLLSELLQEARSLQENSLEWKYLPVFRRTQKALCSLQPIQVDGVRLAAHEQSAQHGRKEELRSFKGGGQVCYSRKTTTGRLTVESGPRVLTVDKKYRDVVRSRHGKDGRIVQLDYVSLEPRTILGLTRSSTPADVYSLFDERVPDLPRPVRKVATMTVLYGGSLGRLSQVIGVEHDPRRVQAEIRDIFNLRALEKALVEEFEVAKLLSNFYGRVMHLNRGDPGYLVAAYIQSTAVDVALQGFEQICDAAQAIDGVDPIAVVHDAIWLDVHRDCVKQVKQLKELGTRIPDFEIDFPLGVELVRN